MNISGRLPRALLLACALIPLVARAQAGSFAERCPLYQVSGRLRTDYFSKLYGSPGKPNRHAFAAAGILNLRARPFLEGVCVGASLFYANSLGLNGSDENQVYTTLMGMNHQLTAPGQAYLQWQRPGLLIRGGDQILDTPWMGPRDSRVFPQTFQGLYAAAFPTRGIALEAMRIVAWKSRTSDDYSRDNLYYPTYYEDDELFGTKRILPPSTAEAPGTLALGLRYRGHPFSGQVWVYDFYRFARLLYADGTYSLIHTGATHLFVSAQYAREWSGSDNYFAHYGATLFTPTGTGGVDATLYGARLGLQGRNWRLQVSVNRLEHHAGAFGGGALVSPYGNNGALYTSFMTNNLLSYGPGTAFAIRGTCWALGHRFRFTAAAGAFDTAYNGHPDGVYLDARYQPPFLKGLSIRDRIAIDQGLPSFEGGYYLNNRFMVQYRF